MEENKNLESETTTGDGAVDTPTETTEDVEVIKETVTMSKLDFDKAVQSAEDKVRGKMSKTIKELEERVTSLTPIEKTNEEIEFESRIEALKASEKEVQSQKRKLDVQEQLSGKGIDRSLIEYIKDDTDIEALSGIIDNIVKSRIKSTGYVPGDHGSDVKMTLEDYNKMGYFEKERFLKEHPEAYKRLTGRK